MALRMIEMFVPERVAHRLEDLSAELEVLGQWTEHLDGERMLLRVLVRSERAEAVLHTLERQFGAQPDFRIVLFSVEGTLPYPESETAEPAPAAQSQPPEARDPDRVAVVELVEKLRASVGVRRAFILSVVLSTVVAAIGLVRDNVAVIIGAMVIAPLLSPNMTLALATTLGDAKLAWQAGRIAVLGLGLALALAVGTGLLLPFDPALPQLASRAHVSLSDVVLALAAGSAGALAFTTGLSEALVGVMVAVALLPPTVATGLLVGTGEWSMASRALLLLATNVICVNLAGVSTFLLQGVRPARWWEAARAKRMVRQAALVWIGLLGVLITLIVLADL